MTRIFVSHGHVDHYGARPLRPGAARRRGPRHAHPADASKIAEGAPAWRDGRPRTPPSWRSSGSAGGRPRAPREGERTFSFARRLREVRPLGDGDVVRARHLELRALHMPGHTPGLVCLHEPARGLLFAGDHLLEKVSPNPLIELGPNGEEDYFRPLLAYLASIARTRALELELVLPGHGPPFGDHRAVIDRLVGFYGKRQEKVRALLAAGPLTPWDVSRALFPSAPTAQTFLVVSETLANLEVLEARGELRRTLVDGTIRFAAAGRAMMDLLSSPEALDLPRDPRRDGDRPRHRQHHLHLHPGRASCRAEQQREARRIGLALALVHAARLLLLASRWVMGLTAPLFSLVGHGCLRARPDPARRRPVPARQGDASRSTTSSRSKREREAAAAARRPSFWRVIVQIVRHRHRVLARLGDHRGGHGRASFAVMVAAMVIAVGW